jgi:hypothetical protein
MRAFRAVVDSYAPRLAMLRIGTQGDDYEYGISWRRQFYESEGWVTFKSPPIQGLVIVWMYHLLEPLSVTDRALRNCLIEKEQKADLFGPIEP